MSNLSLKTVTGVERVSNHTLSGVFSHPLDGAATRRAPVPIFVEGVIIAIVVDGVP
ncbi:MAG: hypothetical protein OXT74_04300 [Candidatus Poribacteria bacterium]|nr:hypothetical protein [Candidatus Poribacteria bacterium]